MSKIIKAEPREKVARVKCDRCGTTTEFHSSDVTSDREGSYVICPGPGHVHFISTNVLKWKRSNPKKS